VRGVYVIIFLCTVIAALVAIGQLLQRRRCRQIDDIIAALGGQVVSIRYTAMPCIRNIVEYIGPQGELRQAWLARGETQLRDDRPFQVALRDQYRNSTVDLLAALRLAAQYHRLPGFEEYKSLLRDLAAGTLESATIQEAPGDGQPRWRFAPMLQCIEAMSIGSKTLSDQTLRLKVDGGNVDVHWSIQGTIPNRSLLVRAIGPRT
jgi:hypothetical protein